jgi:hypothetical protein
VFLQLWQIEELEPENFDVWQGKNLEAVSVAPGREDNDRACPVRITYNIHLVLCNLIKYIYRKF